MLSTHTHTHIHIHAVTHTHTHTRGHTHMYIHTYKFLCIWVCEAGRVYIYIYIYIYWQHFFVNTYFVEHNRHFLPTYAFVDPFLLPYWFKNIRRELVDVSSIIVYFPSTFCLTLGHYQGRIYYKSDVTFVCTLLLCKKKSVCNVAVCSVYFKICFYKECQ